MQKNILVVEPVDLCLPLTKELANKTSSVSAINNIAAAKEILRKDVFDLVLIDLSLPDGNGLEFYSDLPSISKNPSIAAVIISTDGNIPNLVTAYSLGVLDYITKPFHPVEFKARIERALKSKSVNRSVGNGFLRLFTDSLKAEIKIEANWQPLELTLKEFQLLKLLLTSGNQILSRQYILDTVWGAGVHVSERAIDTHMVGLRKKISPSGYFIDSIRGIGYRLSEALIKNQKAS